MNKKGFALIEVILLITVLGLMGSTLAIIVTNVTSYASTIMNNTIARQTARQCLDWFVGQRQLYGYASMTCPSTTVPSYCTAPSGFTVAVNIVCTTISSDANYQTVTVTVTGSILTSTGAGKSTLTTLLASY